jgi:hypothetical protein
MLIKVYPPPVSLIVVLSIPAPTKLIDFDPTDIEDDHEAEPAGIVIVSPLCAALLTHAATSVRDASAAIRLGLLPPQAAKAFAVKRLVASIIARKAFFKFFILHLHTVYKSQIRGVTSVMIITKTGGGGNSGVNSVIFVTQTNGSERVF